MARRDMGKLVFLDLVDRTGRIQLLCPVERTGEIDVHLGDIVGVTGSPAKSRRGEPSLQVDSLEVLARIRTPLPDTFHGLTDVEQRYRKRYLDLLMNEESRDGRARSARAWSRRSAATSTSGASSRWRRRSSSRATAARSPSRSSRTTNALDEDRYLRIATELYLKRLIVGGLEKVYEIGKDFRNEGVSFKHHPEFTMLEWYEAYADYSDTMERIEQLVSRTAQRGARDDEGRRSRATRSTSRAPWRAREVRRRARGAGLWTRDEDELRRRLEERDVDVSHDPTWSKLIDHAHSRFVEPSLIQPTILYDYPIELSPFARTTDDDPTIVERFEYFAGGIELGNAFTEINDAEEQAERFALQQAERAGRRRRGRGGRPRLRRGALLRHAADGRHRARHRPARDALHRQRVDPRRRPLPARCAAHSDVELRDSIEHRRAARCARSRRRGSRRASGRAPSRSRS